MKCILRSIMRFYCVKNDCNNPIELCNGHGMKIFKCIEFYFGRGVNFLGIYYCDTNSGLICQIINFHEFHRKNKKIRILKLMICVTDNFKYVSKIFLMALIFHTFLKILPKIKLNCTSSPKLGY